MKRLNILYVSSMFTLGGIETLAIRLAKDNAHNVALLSSSSMDKSIRKELENINVSFIEVYFSYLKFFLGKYDEVLKDEIEKIFPNGVDVIFSFDSTNLFYSLYLGTLMKRCPKIVTGVYHPSEYSWKPEFFNFTSILIKKALVKLPRDNIIFMNEACRNNSLKIDTNFLQSPIVPLPVDVKKYYSETKSFYKYKIVSVGRICDFKTYNFTMLEVMKELIQIDKKFEYHIYGHGPLEQELLNHIASLRLDKNVFFHGKMEYNDFSSVLSDAYIFIGMGTSIVEACAAGVPSILAIGGERAKNCFGWFHNRTGYDVGENDELSDNKVSLLYDEIMFLYRNEEYYLEYSKKSIERANDFDQSCVLELLYKVMKNSSQFPIDRIRIKLSFLIIGLENKIFKLLKIKCPNRFRHALRKI